MRATIWHNPRCSKSRAALALLEEAGAEVTVFDYLGAPLTADALARFYARAGMSPRDGLRRGEPAAADLANASDADILDAMVLNPALIERPLVETERGALLARPPGRVRDLLLPTP